MSDIIIIKFLCNFTGIYYTGSMKCLAKEQKGSTMLPSSLPPTPHTNTEICPDPSWMVSCLVVIVILVVLAHGAVVDHHLVGDGGRGFLHLEPVLDVLMRLADQDPVGHAVQLKVLVHFLN